MGRNDRRNKTQPSNDPRRLENASSSNPSIPDRLPSTWTENFLARFESRPLSPNLSTKIRLEENDQIDQEIDFKLTPYHPSDDTPLHPPPDRDYDSWESFVKVKPLSTIHMKEHFEPTDGTEENHQCNQCGFAAPNKRQLKIHTKLDHGSESDRYTCDDCDYVTIDHSKLLRHKKIHSEVKEFQCGHCPLRTRHKHNLEHHVKTHLRFKEKKCSDCSYRTLDEAKMTIHLQLHLRKYSTRCDQCEYTCATDEMLELHLKTEHGILQAHVCDKCQKVCASRIALEEHRKTFHDKANKSKKKTLYQCQRCPFATAKMTLLSMHNKRTHNTTGMKKHVCNECPFEAIEQKTVIQHQKLVHLKPDKIHHCTKCPFTTSRQANLNRHINSEHPKHFKCQQCPFVTRSSDLLSLHLKSNHSVKQLNCVQCRSTLIRPAEDKTTDFLCEKCRLGITSDKPEPRANSKPRTKVANRKDKCDRCDFETTHEPLLRLHCYELHNERSTEDNNIAFKCDKCQFVADCIELINIHARKVHERMKKFQCEQCLFETEIAQNFDFHVSVVHKKVKNIDVRYLDENGFFATSNGLRCDKCAFEASRSEDLALHVNYAHRNMRYVVRCNDDRLSPFTNDEDADDPLQLSKKDFEVSSVGMETFGLGNQVGVEEDLVLGCDWSPRSLDDNKENLEDISSAGLEGTRRAVVILIRSVSKSESSDHLKLCEESDFTLGAGLSLTLPNQTQEFEPNMKNEDGFFHR